LGEIARRDVAGEQADDGHNDQKFEKGEAAGFLLPGDQFEPSVRWFRRVAGTDFYAGEFYSRLRFYSAPFNYLAYKKCGQLS
jgi:hypothetical protein